VVQVRPLSRRSERSMIISSREHVGDFFVFRADGCGVGTEQEWTRVEKLMCSFLWGVIQEWLCGFRDTRECTKEEERAGYSSSSTVFMSEMRKIACAGAAGLRTRGKSRRHGVNDMFLLQILVFKRRRRCLWGWIVRDI
jgi:hypothetical protein